MILKASFTIEDLSTIAWKNLKKFTGKKNKENRKQKTEKESECERSIAFLCMFRCAQREIKNAQEE